MAKPRVLARSETHDLSMIIRDRTKVLTAHVEAEKARLLADFEQQIAAEYEFDQDATWKAAAERARAVAEEAAETIAKRCEELGIPRTFAPTLGIYWQSRGENGVASRRAELRRVAKAEVEAMGRAAIVKVQRDSLELRTQVVAMGLLSDDAKAFLHTLKPVEEAMRPLDLRKIERRLGDEDATRRKTLGFNRYDA